MLLLYPNPPTCTTYKPVSSVISNDSLRRPDSLYNVLLPLLQPVPGRPGEPPADGQPQGRQTSGRQDTAVALPVLLLPGQGGLQLDVGGDVVEDAEDPVAKDEEGHQSRQAHVDHPVGHLQLLHGRVGLQPGECMLQKLNFWIFKEYLGILNLS